MSETRFPIVCPLTEAQKGIYIECMNEPMSLKYNIPFQITIPGGTDLPRFLDAVRTVIAAHPVLSVKLCMKDGEPSMVCDGTPAAIISAEVDDLITGFSSLIRPFDFDKDALARVYLLTAKDGRHAMLFECHHMIADGTSIGLITAQIAEAYRTGKCEAEELSIFDVSRLESTPRDEKKYRADSDYFEKIFDGAETDCFPTPDSVADTGIPASRADWIETDITDKLDQYKVASFAASVGVNENAVYQSAFAVTLAALLGTRECTYTTVYHGRSDKRLMKTFGAFIKMLPMHAVLDNDKSAADFVREIYDEYFGVRTHDSVTFGEVAEKYGVNSDMSFLYQSTILDGVPFGDTRLAADVLEPGEIPAKFDMMIIRSGGRLYQRIHYRPSLMTEGFIKALGRMYVGAANALMNAKTLGEIICTDENTLADYAAVNRTEVPYDDKNTIVAQFRAQAKRTPDNDCLAYLDKRYTFAQVDALTDNLAAYLVKQGVGKEKVVGVLIPRCEYMLIASLGVLKAGGAYMPLDPTYPKERLNLMMNDSGAMLLITTPSLSDVITSGFTGMRLMTDDIMTLPACDITLPEPQIHDLFVLLYTSGSTGVPKGVMFEHANVMVTTAFVRRFYDMDETSRVTAYASYGFDANTYDMYPAVTSGACLHIIAEEMRLDFLTLRDYFNQNGITHTVMTTQVGRQFALMGGFTTLKHLSVGGEKLTPLDPPATFKMHDVYGPTEGSVITSAFTLDGRYKDIPIGRPVDNLKIYVTDKEGRLLPVGAVGELWIAGPHVTRGYLNRPEKTAEAYGSNPFEQIEGYERIYRTGDIVRLMPDGNLQFIGRRDAQVKVRGFRVELTEVEEIIRRYDGVKDVTVAAFDEPHGGKYIAAYIVSDEEIDEGALGDFIRTVKPPYMVPSVVMRIDRIPLNQNQKVNRRALPLPVRKAEQTVPPENDTQKKIFDIVASVVGHTSFGVDSDIYDAGLTSIGAIKLNVALAESFGVPLRLADVKANATVRKLEAFLTASAPEETYQKQADYPVTLSQYGVFVECMNAPDTTVYNIPVMMKLGETIDAGRLAEAVKAAADAHPYVKATLLTDETGALRAKRNDDAVIGVPVIECDALPDASALVKPFDLLHDTLMRAAIYRAKDGLYLFTDFHHIISDGTSMGVFYRDISRAYAGEKLTAEVYTGFEAALDEEKLMQSERAEADMAYWKGILSGCETGCLPKKEPEYGMSGAGSVTLDADAADIVRYCENNALSVNAFFNGVLAFVLGRFASKEDVSYTTVFNGRNDSRLTDAVMFLARTVPISLAIDYGKSVKDYFAAMREQLIGAMTHDAVSFAELSNTYGIRADVILTYQGDSFRFDTLCGEKAETVTVTTDTAAKAPISVSIELQSGRFVFVLEYRRDLYSADFAKHFLDALTAAAKSFTESEKLSDITMLSEMAEDVYARMNGTDFESNGIAVPDMITHQAMKTPDEIAVLAAGKTLTCRELNERANRLANALIRRGVTADTVVGMVLERTAEVLVAEIGIMKAGGAFLPMLPSYPDERLDYCLTDSDSPFVLTTAAIRASKPNLFAEGKAYETLLIEELTEESGDASEPAVTLTPEQLCYCIYTSGSTGTPKGVMIGHRCFANFMQSHANLYDYITDPANTGYMISTSSISFDMSVMELLLPLYCGKRTCIATDEECHNPLMMRDLMVNANVQMAIFTPSFLNNIIGIPEMAPAIKGLKTLMLGAEAFPPSLYESVKRVSPDVQLFNGYGPTEATICCAVKELHSPHGITIGGPIGNMRFFVTDAFGHILPPYAMGELILCGSSVGRGYVKLPEKTAASFFTLRGLPAYHSGDLVRVTAKGEIDFGGRIDNQVKLRGFRVELDEIEKVICTFDGVLVSKVIVRNNGTEDYLAGFFTAERKIDTDALTAHLKSRLTYYMVPSVLIQLDAMPLTANGKIDKKALPETVRSEKRKEKKRVPKKSLEQRLCEVYAGALGREADEVYADDNFFELGGTSLSASKVTMVLMAEGIEVKYGDIFDHPSPEELAAFILSRDGAPNAFNSALDTEKKAEKTGDTVKYCAYGTRETLSHNMVKYAGEVKREPLGDVLLTGAVGFLGIHVLNELISSETGHIYCLVRRGSHETPEIRLKTMLIYYFSNGFEDALRDRITVIDADITDDTLETAFENISFNTVINCAACVKHFTEGDELTRINVHGVANLIALCKKKNAKLIQISTVSIPGLHTGESYEKQIKMHENELFMIDDMDNKYVKSKYEAELLVYDAIDEGLRAKVIRVGNLMGRHSDGEFQANFETNMFLRGIRGFAIMRKYPISHMTDPMSFSPVDCTARAVVLLAGTNDCFTAFNCDNRYGFDEMKLIDACNRLGITILPEEDEIYYKEFREKLADDRVNEGLNGLAAYDIKDAHAVETDNLFTTNVLYRIGFAWPLTDDTYLDRAIESILTLDYFDLENDDEN